MPLFCYGRALILSCFDIFRSKIDRGYGTARRPKNLTGYNSIETSGMRELHREMKSIETVTESNSILFPSGLTLKH